MQPRSAQAPRRSCMGSPVPKKRRHQDDKAFHNLMFIRHKLRLCLIAPQSDLFQKGPRLHDRRGMALKCG